MNLIPISSNVLVNPECISCVEQRNIQGTIVTYVWVDNKEYILSVPLNEFYKNLGLYSEDGETKQEWAG